LQAALVNKDAADKSLNIHRLIQRAALRRLTESEKQRYFAVSAKLLSLGFPDTWSKDVGHQKAEWSRCERYLPHVNNMVKVATENPAIVSQPDEWANLLLRCSWYLYEKEQYEYARLFTRSALDTFTDKQTLAYASAIDLLGLVDLDLQRPQDALTSFQIGTSIRQAILSNNDPLIAFALNNLALAHTELAELETAENYHKQAIDIRISNNSDRIGNSYSNYAVTLLRMGRPDEAEKTLMQCPSLQGCSDETFLSAENPRFVGDMVLLSRIRKAQGRTDDAMRLAGKALSWREKTHGDRYKTCDSAYDVSCLLYDGGKDASALDALAKVSRIAETLEGGDGHAARAEWKTSQILKAQGKESLANDHLDRAKTLRLGMRPNEGSTALVDESWERLTPYMLW
jgi:tetratricopeptide (TPR) repeat protein